MELVFSSEDMTKAMQVVDRAIARSNVLPVLSNVLISAAHSPLSGVSGSAEDEADSIYVAATDMEVGIQTRIPGQVIENGAITLPAKTFASVIKALSKEEVKLITSRDKARICCQNGEFKVVGMPADEFPSLALIGNTVGDAQLELTAETEEKKEIDFLNLDSGVLGLMLRKTSFAAGRDENRYFLNGVHLSLRNNSSEGNGSPRTRGLLKMAATDGVRLAVASASTEETLEKDVGVIIPNRAVKELERLTMRSDAVKMGFQENRIIFDMGDAALVSVLLEGEYPDYERAIPAQTSIVLKVDTGRLLSAARRMAQVANPKQPWVRLEVKGARLEVSASDAYVGDGYEDMDIDHEGDDVEVALNVRYLMDALGAIDSQEALIGINGAVLPVVIKPSIPADAVTNHLCVLMPIRVADSRQSKE